AFPTARRPIANLPRASLRRLNDITIIAHNRRFHDLPARCHGIWMPTPMRGRTRLALEQACEIL
ncbi:MAG: hypothetical protein VXW25_06015, partial [Pseudomonadota bacterium]|nr:hypothetical protein [Pseudomonadota bacterium]